jgi:hypothetical protein
MSEVHPVLYLLQYVLLTCGHHFSCLMQWVTPLCDMCFIHLYRGS